MSWFDINDWIPDETATPEQQASWRKRIALVACSCWMLTMFAIIPVLTTGLPLIGRVAYADTTNREVDAKVQQKTGPLQESIERLKIAVEAQTRSSKATLARVAADQIRSLTKEWCEETDERKRARLAQQIDVERQEYYNATEPQREYPPQFCADLMSKPKRG